MKTIFVISIAFCAASCGVHFNTNNGIEGDGNIVTENRDLNNFSSVENSTVFNIHISSADSFSFKAVADANVLALLTTRIDDNRLVIETPESSFRHVSKADIYITMVTLQELDNRGVGNTELNKVVGTNLHIQNKGVGNLHCDLDYNRVYCDNKGVGNVELKGRVTYLNLSNKGVGSVRATDIDPDTAYINNSGTGNIKIRCAKVLSIINRGVGSVQYYGEATLKEVESQGVGSVKRGSAD